MLSKILTRTSHRHSNVTVVCWIAFIYQSFHQRDMETNFVLLTSLLFYLIHTVSSDICSSNAPTGSVDGCSIPANLPFPHKSDFNAACNSHDVCYDCAAHFGKSRIDCDHAFLRHMYSICNHPIRRFLLNGDTECKSTAIVYYEAVHLAAGSHFSDVSKSYCSESWVRTCLGHL